MKRIIIAGLMLLLVSGCALGPNYQPPKAQVPIKYKNDAPWKAATPKDTHPKGRWWEIYNDPMLNQLEEQAAEANQSLQAAYARLTQAQAALGITQADRVPRIDLNARAGRERTGADLSGTANGQVDSQFNLPLILDYELDLWGRVKRSIESAQADSQSAVADYQSLLLSLQAELARTYFSIGETDAEIALLQQTIKLRREARDLVKDKYDSGQVDLLDLSRAEAELAFTQAEAVGLTRQRGELENSIAVLIGQPPSIFFLAVVALPSAPPEVVPGLPSDLLERRPDVAAAERQMAAASAQIGVAQTAFFPSIRITGSTGFASSQFGSLFNWDNRTWGLGPAISLPIFDGHRNTANLEKARASYEEAVANYRQQVLGAFQEVENGLNGLESLDRQARSLKQATAMSKQAWDISEKRYQAGLVSYLEVVDAQRSALQAEQALTQLRGEQMNTSVLLIKALGGGWESTNSLAANAKIQKYN